MEKTGIILDEEKDSLKKVLSALNIAEKKARIYSRLLTDVSLAKAMEEIACKHEKQKERIQVLLYGQAKKTAKKQKETGMDGESEQ